MEIKSYTKKPVEIKAVHLVDGNDPQAIALWYCLWGWGCLGHNTLMAGNLINKLIGD